jgi:hypothetical protein
VSLRTILLSVHTSALVAGVISATIVYGYFLLELRNRPLEQKHLRFIGTISLVVTCALVALWASGISLAWLKISEDERFLWSAKLHAKLTIVSILTLNGLFIHAKILPIIRRAVGQKLFRAINAEERGMLLNGGGISFVSWYVPLALGYSKEIDGVVPLYAILLLYACLISGALIMARVVSVLLAAENREVDSLKSLKDHLQARGLSRQHAGSVDRAAARAPAP